MERQQRTRLTTVLILGLVFGTGFVLGIAFDRRVTSPVAAESEGEAVAAGGEEGEEEDGSRSPLYTRVGSLDAEQEARIDSIVGQYREAGRALWQEWEEQYEPLRREREAWEEENVAPLWRRWAARRDSLTEATRAKIKDVMTPEQAERYDSLVADWERRREERRRERDSSGGSRD